ncbi:MAG TPA: alkaline phosphatase family protein [Gemmataceae bacterium]|nr:alkaline phosphatase family protein [Gemmataceae bacterium]
MLRIQGMKRSKKASLICGLAASVVLLALSGCQGIMPSATSTDPPMQGAVNHIIFMLQENHSFDSYFGKLNDYRASQGLGRDVDDLEATFFNPADDGTFVGNFHIPTACIFDDTAAWQETWGDMNRFDSPNGPLLLDGFAHTGGLFALDNGLADTKGKRAMGFYDSNDLTSPYFFATQFATSDRFYTPAPLQTAVVRLWSMGATSQGFLRPLSETGNHLTAKTIFELLDDAGVTWKIYSVDVGPDGKLLTSLRNFQPYGLHQESRIVPISEYFADLANGTLPQFAYIEPGFISNLDEHPGAGTPITKGAQFVATLIQALINSTSWKDSIFIEAFDEGGGLFDHVGPMIDGKPIQALAKHGDGQAVGPAMYPSDATPQHVPNPDGIRPRDIRGGDPAGNFTRTGFRVPLIIVSPFAKPHFVSHTPMDYTAVLKFVEMRFGLPSLNQRDAAQTDMSEFFDFVNSPNLTPPAPPPQPMHLPCNPLLASAP